MTDRSKRNFDRMIERHREEIQRHLRETRQARDELDERLRKAAAEARETARRTSERIQGYVDAARAEFERPRAKRPRRRFPRRGLEGGEPVPVEPRPKPKPLMDGAKAPIE